MSVLIVCKVRFDSSQATYHKPFGLALHTRYLLFNLLYSSIVIGIIKMFLEKFSMIFQSKLTFRPLHMRGVLILLHTRKCVLNHSFTLLQICILTPLNRYRCTERHMYLVKGVPMFLGKQIQVYRKTHVFG